MLPFRFRGYQRTAVLRGKMYVRKLIVRSVTRSLIFFVSACVTGLTSRRRRYVFRRITSGHRATWKRDADYIARVRDALFPRDLLLLERPARSHHAGNLIFDDVVHSLTGNMSFRQSMTRLCYALPKNIKRGENGSAELRSLPERDFCRSL